MNDDTRVVVEGLWKRYGPPMRYALRRLKRAVSRAVARPGASAPAPAAAAAGEINASEWTEDGPWALRDVSFRLAPGHTLGLIGRNGSGKSTLLKVLSGISPPTRGRVEVRGRAFSMIELNAGLNPELSGRTNIWMLGAIMGLTRAEIARHMPAIQEFCELGRWIDRPVREYSSGMQARLGFSVAVNVEADILLIDEVLAVGDLPFRLKCYDRFESLRRQGVATVFVSHSMRQVERLCDEVVFLDEGRVSRRGPPSDVCGLYYQMGVSQRNQAERGRLPPSAIVESSGEMEVETVEVLDERGAPTTALSALGPARIRVAYTAPAPLKDLIIGLFIVSSDMIAVSGFNTRQGTSGPVSLPAGKGSFEATIPRLSLLSGVFTLNLAVKAENGRTVFDGTNLAWFSVEHSSRAKDSYGLVHTDAEWTLPEAPERMEASRCVAG